MKYKVEKSAISYPFELIDIRKNFPSNHVAPCSILIDEKEIGGLFIACSSKDIEFFNIISSSPPEPPLKFRMLDYEKKIFIIEIWLQFGENPEKFLKIHLNPHDLNVKKLLKLGSENNMISFLFYDTETNLLSTAITSFSNEESDWFNRNYKLSTRLVSDRRGYNSLAKRVCKMGTNSDRFYIYYTQNRNDFFVKEGGNQVILSDFKNK